MKLIDNSYVITVFGHFEDIEPTPDNMVLLMNSLKEYGMIPTIFQEPTLDVANPLIRRIGFISGDNNEILTIASNKIDYKIVITDEKELDKHELKSLNDKVCKIFGFIFEQFNKKPSRLALNTGKLFIKLSNEEIGVFMKKYSNPISIYNETLPTEWKTQFTTRKEVKICDKENILNVTTTISKTKRLASIDDVFFIQFDINTALENQKSLFNAEYLIDFILQAVELQNKIISDIG